MAGRHTKTTANYFPHFARIGKKMRYLLRRYGNDGYAVWYRLMEEFTTANNHHLDISDKYELAYLADKFLVEIDTLIEILDYLADTGWLHQKLWSDARVLYSEEFTCHIKYAYKRRKNECINTEAILFMYHINAQEGANMYSEKQQRKEKKRKEKDSTTENQLENDQKNIENREQKFKQDVFSYDYPDYLLKAFFSYWSEPNKSKTKMRYEMQKTWDTKRRLATWASRDDKYSETVEAKKRADSKIIRYD